MLNSNAAEGCKQNSSRQRQFGRQLIQDYADLLPGAAILDLGCATGELSTYLAELVGQNGNVTV